MSNGTAAPKKLKYSISTGVPSGARALIWEVFFASRQRGIDLPTHFPWIEQNIGTYCLAFSEKSEGPVVATLVLREYDQSTGSRCALIGMVCVDKPWRGQGLSTQLLTNMLHFSADQKINSLLLWTGQPRVYSRHGFVSDTCETFSRVTLDPLRPRAQVRFHRGPANTSRGLPPFAQQLIRFESNAAELIVMETTHEITLAEWKGSPSAALDLIEAALPTTWHLNAPADALIFDEIRKRGHSLMPLPCATRMVRNLGLPEHIPYISVLDRI